MIMSDPPIDGFDQPHPPLAPIPVEIAEETGTRSVVDRAALPPISKKTRELPNLAECHSCGFRINTSNGQDKLRILKSEWRIVLLCLKCYRRAVRGELCTYCLGEVSGEESFKCGKCSCCVHKDCVSKFSEFPPWSYFDWRSSSVCLDCWLPCKVQKLRNIQGRIQRMGNNDNGNKKKLIGHGRKDVDDAVEKRAQLVEKPRMDFKAREHSLCKSMVGKTGAGKENSGFNLAVSGELGQRRKGVDDAELAFQLHRVINSSPRISRNPRSLSSYHVNKINRQAGRNVPSVKISAFLQRNRVTGGDFNSSVNKGFDSKDERAKGALKEGQGSCSNNSMDAESFSWKELDLPKPELKFTYGRKKCSSNVDGRHERYMFKYSRKRSRLAELVARKYTYLYDKSTYESETSSTAIVLQSYNESRKFSDSCVLALPVSMSANGPSQNKV